MTIQLPRASWEAALYAADIDPSLGPNDTEGPYVDMAYNGRYGNDEPRVAIVGTVQFTAVFLVQLALELHACDEDEEDLTHLAVELAQSVQAANYGNHEACYFPGLEIVG